MKSTFAMAASTAILVAAALAGCTTMSSAQEDHIRHHPATDASQRGMGMAGGMGMMGGGMGMGGGRGMMMPDADMKSMCEMHEQMMRANSPEEQNAIMAEHMKNMPPQMRQQYMGMMQSHMQMMQEYMKNQPPGR